MGVICLDNGFLEPYLRKKHKHVYTFHFVLLKNIPKLIDCPV